MSTTDETTERPAAPLATEPGPIIPEKAKGRERGSVLQLAGASYLVTVLSMVTGPLVARSLGPTDRGLYASVSVYQSLTVTIFTFGLSIAAAHALTNGLTTPQALLGTVLRFCAWLIAPTLAVTAILIAFVLPHLSGGSWIPAAAIIGVAPLGVLGLSIQSILMSSGALRPLTIMRVAPLLINFVGVVGLFVVGKLTLWTYLWLTVAVVLVTPVLSWMVAGVRPRGRAPLRPLLKFGSKAYVGSFATFFNANVDQALLATYVAPAQLGYYAIGVTISVVPQSLAQAIGARTVGSIHTPDRRLDVPAAERFMRLAFLVSIIAVAGIALVSPVIVPFVYGHDFSNVVDPLLLLLPGAVALAATQVSAPCLLVIGKPGTTSIAQFVGLGVTAVGLWLTLPPWGILGAAITSTVAYWTRLGVMLWALRRHEVRAIIPRPSDLIALIRTLVARLPAPLRAVPLLGRHG